VKFVVSTTSVCFPVDAARMSADIRDVAAPATGRTRVVVETTNFTDRVGAFNGRIARS